MVLRMPKPRRVQGSHSLTTSSLRGLQAFEVIEGLHEGMHSRCLRQCAVGSPLFIFLLAFWPESFAHRVRREVPNSDLVDTVQVHAPLHEEILSPRLHASVFLLPLPIQGLGAIIQVCQEGAEALVTDHLQVAKESVVHVPAVLQVNTAPSPSNSRP